MELGSGIAIGALCIGLFSSVTVTIIKLAGNKKYVPREMFDLVNKNIANKFDVIDERLKIIEFKIDDLRKQ